MGTKRPFGDQKSYENRLTIAKSTSAKIHRDVVTLSAVEDCMARIIVICDERVCRSVREVLWKDITTCSLRHFCACNR